MGYKPLLFTLVCVLLLCGCSVPASTDSSSPSVLIDPGHGGFDGGTSAADGTLEKDLNLAVSLQLRDMLSVCGIAVAMTRETDVSTESSDATSIREKKVSDLRNRLALYERSSLVIAVHQNHFSSSQYSGTQVFYSGNHPNSAEIANALQRSVATRVQPQNNRQIKKATDGIYLMYHTSVPAVLVECGFLSNAQELSQLKDPQYRQALAWAITLGYWDYIMET